DAERAGMAGCVSSAWSLVRCRWLLTLAAAAAALVWSPSPLSAAPHSIPPADRRFADPAVQEVPDFQRHVLPLLGRLGCNGRACHGSFQGQGGFRLSLFGYDFKADHQAIAAPEHGRVDLDSPANSLVVQKPSFAVDHD